MDSTETWVAPGGDVSMARGPGGYQLNLPESVAGAMGALLAELDGRGWLASELKHVLAGLNALGPKPPGWHRAWADPDQPAGTHALHCGSLMWHEGHEWRGPVPERTEVYWCRGRRPMRRVGVERDAS